MPLILPPPRTAQEEAADALIRNIERTAPILPSGPRRPWLLALIDVTQAPGADRRSVACALVRILRHLPLTSVDEQWAVGLVLWHVPSAGLSQAARSGLDHILGAIRGLHRFGMQDPPPSPEQLAAEAGRLTDALLNPRPGVAPLALVDLLSFRVGYVTLVDRITLP